MTGENSAVQLSEEALIAEHGEELKRLIESEMIADISVDRIAQIRDALRNILYWKSHQYVIPEFDPSSGTFDCTCVSGDTEEDKEMFRSVYNIFKSDGQVFVGAVAPRASNVTVVPEDPENDQQDIQARMGDALTQDFWDQWDADAIQKMLAYHAWTSGPSFIYQYWNADGHKYGYHEEPVIDVRDEMMPDGSITQVPFESGVKRYPKGKVEIKTLNCLYVTVPFNCRDRSDVPWLIYESHEHKAILKDLYEALSIEDDNDSGGQDAGSQAALEAQERVQSPLAQAPEAWKRQEWRHTRVWLRPAMYNMVRNGSVMPEEDGSPSIPLKDVLKEQFPDGLKVVLVNGKPVEAKHERLDDHWTICKPGSGEFIADPPWGNDVIPMQDDLNNLINYAKEIVLRSIVKTVVSTELIDRESAKGSDNMVHELIFTKNAVGGDIRTMMAAMPQGTMPEKMVDLITYLRDLSRQVDGANEALAGGGTPAETYRAERQRRDQSVSRFTPFVNETKKAYKSIARNGIIIKVRFGQGPERIPVKGGGMVDVDLEAIGETGWKIAVEEGLPMSFTEESDRVLGTLQENPAVAEQFGYFRPENIDVTNRMIGVRGITPPGETERRKFAEIVKELVELQPVETVDETTGYPTTMPAIEPDETDDFALMAEISRTYLNSAVGLKLKKQNPTGFKSVLAYFRACRQLQAQQMAQDNMMATAGGAPPPGEELNSKSGGDAKEPPPTAEEAETFSTAPPQL